jgi:hypothetical protein
MKIEINGNYSIQDLVPVFQHLVAQLEALGVEAVEGTIVELVPQNARGRRLGLADDAGEVERLRLEISDLARPCVGTGRLKVVEAPAPQRTRRVSKAPARRLRRN